MKSLLRLSAILLVAALAHIQAASPSPSPSAKPSPSPTAKSSPKAKASATPSATPDKSGLPDPVAIVDGKQIKRAELEQEFDAQLAAMGRTADSIPPEKIRQGYRELLEAMVLDRLLKSRSAKVKVSDAELDKEIQKFKDENQFTGTDAELEAALKKVGQSLDTLKMTLRVRLQQNKWIDAQIADKIKVTDADAKSFYDAHPDQFQEGKEVRVSHILIAVPEDATPAVEADKEKLANQTKERITKGEDFAKVAGEVSEDPESKKNGGDLVKYISRDSEINNALPEFVDAAFKLKKGEVSDPVKTKLGWHIIKVTDIKEAQTIPYDKAREAIIEGLTQEKEPAAVRELLTTLMDKNAKLFLPPVAAAPAPEEGAQQPADQGAMGGPGPGPDTQPPADQKSPGSLPGPQ